MNFNQHYELEGKHAFLSGSNHYWTNYTIDKLKAVYENSKAKEEGVLLHSFASIAVQKRLKLAKLKKALNLFVNDAIGFNMQSEQVLYYSDNCFGTADAIAYRNGKLQIYDLKTGISKVSFRQLDVYAAIFCLEYSVNPFEIEIEQRIYQGNGYVEQYAEPESIKEIMNRIVEFDIVIDNIKHSKR